MEKDRVQKQHRCRICQKSFPCGRSLGGHMRSHSVSSDAEKGKKLIEKNEEKEKKPNKRWRRLSGEASKLCKEFPSWKKLYGHMSCHSDKTFWRCFEAEHEQERDSVPIAAATASSSSTTEYEPEQEAVAISLMMLSRDVSGCWISSEPSDEQYAFLEEDELKRSGLGGSEDSGNESGRKWNNLNAAEFVKNRDESSNGFNAFEAKMGKDELNLESRYQCTTCNRTFHSYQALGGHRARHKRIRGCCLMKIDATISNDAEASAEQLTAMMDNDSLSGLSKKSRSILQYECSICKRIFSSGQALGGHKRSHLNGADGGYSHQENVPELLDLNLPAPVKDEEELSNVKPWWAGESFKHERALVGLISN